MQFLRASRIRDNVASVLCTTTHRDQSIIQKLKDVYEDAKSILRNLRCGRGDDVVPPDYNLPEYRSARPSEARSA